MSDILLDRHLIKNLTPNPIYIDAAKIPRRPANVLMRLFMTSSPLNEKYLKKHARSISYLEKEGLVYSSPTLRFTRRGRQTAKALTLGVLPIINLSSNKQEVLRDRIYNDRVYRIKYDNSIITSNCQVSSTLGDRSIFLNLVEKNDFIIKEKYGKQAKFIFGTSKGTVILKEAIKEELKRLSCSSNRVMTPLLQKTKSETIFLVGFVTNNPVFVKIDSRYIKYMSCYGDNIKIHANLADLKSIDVDGIVTIAWSQNGKLIGMLFNQARKITNDINIKSSISLVYKSN